MGSFANNEDPDEMQQNVSFDKGLHCPQRQNLRSGIASRCCGIA